MNDNKNEITWKVIKVIEPFSSDNLVEATCEECGETNHRGTVRGASSREIIILTDGTETKQLCDTCFNNTSLTYEW